MGNKITADDIAKELSGLATDINSFMRNNESFYVDGDLLFEHVEIITQRYDSRFKIILDVCDITESRSKDKQALKDTIITIIRDKYIQLVFQFHYGLPAFKNFLNLVSWETQMNMLIFMLQKANEL